ncbi:TonB-dependent receptor [Hirschia baltica]|uniref:TonB-dependent receptor n=1 Tax=Hirschia baltica (strain ATCC 49814 / DSM 5838 / IFAM 1418) TaxID=582402 RepID=C6XJC1_HIRBI|nr:TonB-dependent receptor [Hirschia baltica]ACT59216.1 TonB-dependent receptor [Hirschia baltica ATCC 49814]
MSNTKAKLLAGISFSSLFLGGVLPGNAQEIEASQKQQIRTLPTVTVTSQKREETLQSVPVTVTAYSGEMIDQKGLDNIQALSDSTPGLTIDAFPKTTPRPFIRGIGSSNQSAGSDPSSVVFVDGVYIGRGAMLSVDAFDLERLEVLKGPQGTLWGKNVVGGAIHFITAKPKDEFELKARATIAEFGQRDFDFVVNTPVGNHVATRLSLSSKKNNGFRKNFHTGAPLEDEDRLSGRFHALFDIGETSDLLFSIAGTKDDSEGAARFNLLPFNYEDVDSDTNANPDSNNFLKRETWGSKLELNTGVLGWADLTTYVSYLTLDNTTEEDLDGTDVAGNAATGFSGALGIPGVGLIKQEDASSLSAEFRLASNIDGPFSWVGGVFVLKDEIDRLRGTDVLIPVALETYRAKNETDSLAIFGQGTFAINDRWNVSAGLRFTDETKEYEIERFQAISPGDNYTTFGDPGISDEQKWTWKIGSDYQLSDNLFLFGHVSTGFKSGAFQEEPDAATARNAVAPEEVLNYELGVKSDFFDGRARANVSMFYSDYSDLQTIQSVDDATPNSGGARVVVDSGNATIHGIETEFRLLATDNIELSLLYTYLDATFDQFIETSEFLADGTEVFDDLAGNRLSRTPEHATSFSAAYNSDQFSWGAFKIGLDANYQSKIFDDNSNNDLEVRKARTLLDAFFTYEPNTSFSIQVWGRNLTDETYRVHQVGLGPSLFAQYGAPRQIGLTASYTY